MQSNLLHILSTFSASFLPIFLNIYLFRGLERTSSATGLIASKLRFFHTNGSLPDEMRIASKQLYSYNVQDGDEFIIIEKI